MKNLYSKALQYAVSGYSIIPLKKDKKPAIASWLDFQKEPAAEDIIEGWWLKHPDSNIGIITGAISGITVVDIDTKGDTIVPLETFPETFTIVTPSGGYHLYYQYDAEIKQTANTYPQFPHVDIRNDGGYVVAAGSKTDYKTKDSVKAGGEYKIFRKGEIMPFPRELFLTEKTVSKKAKSGLIKKMEEVRDLVDGDGRNNKLCSLLGTMLRGQPKSAYESVRDSFYAVAETMKNPLDRKELEGIWNSIGGKTFEKASMIDLMVNHKGEPFVNLENLRKILAEDLDFKGRVVFDTFLQTYLYRHVAGAAYEELHDTHEITLTREISVKYGGFAMVEPSKVRSALMEVAREHRVDAAADYVNAIEWDKTARLDEWLIKTYNVTDNEYHRAVGSNWFKGMTKRMLDPGCKFDYVLVLEGPQGTKKSTSLGVLGGEWHVETTGSPDSKDFLMLLQGNLIIEFSEGETLSRGEIKQLKALITTQQDKFRSPYERHIQTHPRRCVFAMTTNQSEYLKDETGNRRWLPVTTIGEANIEWLRTNRDQLFAEAAYRVKILKETTHEFPESVLVEQARRQVSDPNEDRIVEWYVGLTDIQKNAGVTADMVNSSAFLHVGGKLTKKDQMDITGVLRGILKLEKKQVTVQGQRYMRWFPPGMVEEDMQSMTMHEAKMAF